MAFPDATVPEATRNRILAQIEAYKLQLKQIDNDEVDALKENSDAVKDEAADLDTEIQAIDHTSELT